MNATKPLRHTMNLSLWLLLWANVTYLEKLPTTNYKALCKIDLPAYLVQLVTWITDAKTSASLPNATFIFRLTNSIDNSMVKQTEFQIKILSIDAYRVTVLQETVIKHRYLPSPFPATNRIA